MNKSSCKVLYLTNIPSPYMVGYLKELAKYVDLTVIFEKRNDSFRPMSWVHSLDCVNFQYIILSGKTISAAIYGDREGAAPDDKAFSPTVLKYISNKYDFIIVANPCTPTGILAILWLKIRKIPFSIQSEGGVPGDGKGFKERLKFFLMNQAEWYFSTCEMDDNYFIRYGATKDKIRRYPFASIKKSDLPSRLLTMQEKELYKKKLGVHTKWFILSVGRSVYVKGFDVLLNAIPLMVTEDVTVGFVGGSCTEEYENIIAKYKLNNVFFIDNVRFEKLKEYYQAADVFVLPTRHDTWGLVINEAMTFGLPVISTNMCVAGNALIKNYRNGFIVPSENPCMIAEKVDFLMANDKIREEMAYRNFQSMRTWTYEEMGSVMNRHIMEITQAK